MGKRIRNIAICIAAGLLGMLSAQSAAASYGLAAFDGFTSASQAGGIFTQAGGHGYDIATTVNINTKVANGSLGPSTVPDGTVKDILTELPPGLMGNPTVAATCNAMELATTPEGAPWGTAACSIDSQIGVVYLKNGDFTYPLSLYNMVPPVGIPARFGFNVLQVPVVLDAAVRGQGAGLHVAIDSRNVSQAINVVGAKVVFWGTPAAASHDGDRCALPPGQLGLVTSSATSPNLCEGEGGGPHSIEDEPVAFLTYPTRCTNAGEGLRFDAASDSWDAPGDFKYDSFETHFLPGFPAAKEEWGLPQGPTGCDAVPVEGALSAQTTAQDAQTPTGLNVNLSIPNPGIENPEGVASSQIKSVEVTLPEGITINPSQAEGLGVCAPAQYESEELAFDPRPGTGCPASAKIGTVEAHTPVLKETLEGSVYVAKPFDNPFSSLLALYVVIKNPERGVMIKLAGEVEPDERTGQIVTTFDNLPQAPISSFSFKFREGARSPLATPSACGAFTTVAKMTPWSDPTKPITSASTFHITHGVGGGPCPSGGLPPFKPGLVAGSINNAAGHYSPFNVRLFRNDGEQEITHFSIKLPPGISGKLAGVPFCPDAAIEAAKTKTGAQEIAGASCPAASEIGHTLVGAGVGSVLTYAHGKIYLAGPYNGSALSIAAITAAKVGPFDLGTVVIRQALKVDPETAEVFIDATGSDPIPHIIDGITTHLRDIRAYVDKPEFTLNPTNCTRTSTASTLLGSGLDFASEIDDRPVTVSTPYQAADCAALSFKPQLKLSLKGGTKRAGHPSLRAVLKMKPGMANIARAQVTLPKSEFLDQSHIGTVCTRVQYAKDQCPAKSVYGYAKAITPILDEPLQGPVYLRSSSHKLPDLVAGLKSGKIEIDLAGRIDSVDGQIRSTFETVPDAPVSKFVLTMQGGKKGLLENSTNLCAKAHKAIVAFDGQNGKISDSSPVVKPQCSKAKRKAAKRRNAR
jgi:hypothetical protein